MAAIDATFARLMWGLQRQLTQIGWGLAGALVAAMIALIVALI